jgi:glycosyltransferase involved in cell wall biosynthesis
MNDTRGGPAAAETFRASCSIVVPVYNGARVIERCLDSLLDQTITPDCYEIIVVDDGSTDLTVSIVNAWAAAHPQVHVSLQQQPHAGPAAARNAGARVARAPLLFFTDADCRATPEWIEALLDGFNVPEHPAGLMGAYLSDQSALAARFAQMEFDDRYRRMARTPAIDVVATYSAAFRRDVFLDENGFDPSFHEANNEDVEFSYRLSEAGHRMHFVPAAKVYHWHADTWSGYARTKMGRGFWRTLVYRRHPGKAVKDTYTPQSLKLEILLAPLVPIGLMMALARRSTSWLLLVGPFLLISLSFVRFAAQRDRVVALASPWGLWLRSMAFAMGIAGGLLASFRRPPRRSRFDSIL